VEEWGDDYATIDRNRQLVTFSDVKGYSTEWLTQSGGNSPTGYMGMTLLKTPEVNGQQLGITDFHYNTAGADDDLDIDSVLYGILSSAASLYSSPNGSRYFHLGANAPDLHFDEPCTIGPGGIDILTWASSGPLSPVRPRRHAHVRHAWVRD